jgi:hypothetical protein
MATIIEYTDQKKPTNSYPKRIISPLTPGACCCSRMEQIGAEQHEEGWSFIYKRCKKCGFAVRHVTVRSTQLFTKKDPRVDCQELTGSHN